MKLRWSRAADRDLRKIGDYIEKDSPGAALRVVRRIRLSADLLRRFPRAGRVGSVPGTRELPISRLPYLLVYDIQRNSIVRVLKVRHGAQLYPPT